MSYFLFHPTVSVAVQRLSGSAKQYAGHLRLLCVSFAVALCALTGVTSQVAADVGDFYKGKVVTITVGSSSGGGYDTNARIVARHLGKFLAGKPNFIVQNEPGARGLISANRLYTTAKRDGTVMSLMLRAMITAQWLIPKEVRFEAKKFNWLLSTTAEPGVAIVWHTAPQKAPTDLLKMETIVGGSGDSAITPLVLNATIGTKFKVISSYPGTAEIVLAMERGEVHGIAHYSWSNIQSKNADWLAEKKIAILLQTGSQRLPELPDVPTISELATSPEKRQIQDLYLAPLEAARPYAMPPDVPMDRVDAVRAAFDAMLKDAAFQTEAKGGGIMIDPRSADFIQSLITRISNAPSSLIEEAKMAIVQK